MQKRSNHIDRGLNQLLRETPRGIPLTRPVIAERCGCTAEYIYLIEKKAINKLRQRSITRELRSAH